MIELPERLAMEKTVLLEDSEVDAKSSSTDGPDRSHVMVEVQWVREETELKATKTVGENAGDAKDEWDSVANAAAVEEAVLESKVHASEPLLPEENIALLFRGKPFQPTQSYATRKTVAEGLLDIALLLANAAQLKAMVSLPEDKRDRFFAAQLSLIGVSILLQVVTGVILFVLGMMNPQDDAGHRRAVNLNNASVGLILFITIVNIFISAFGFNYGV